MVVFAVNQFDLAHEVVIYGIALGTAASVSYYLQHADFLRSTGIAIIPESLIAVLTITMAVGMRTMARRKAIVRKLDALEALGGVDSICSDKTGKPRFSISHCSLSRSLGTLTQGKMITRKVWLPTSGFVSVHDYGDAADPTVGRIAWDGGTPTSPLLTSDSDPVNVEKVTPDLRAFLWAISMCNIATVIYSDTEKKHLVTGEPTEIALLVFAHRFNAGRRRWLNEGWRQLLEFPFDSEVKRMSVVYEQPKAGLLHVFAKGAVERLLDSCTVFGYGDHARPMTDADKETVLNEMQQLARQGLVRSSRSQASHPLI